MLCTARPSGKGEGAPEKMVVLGKIFLNPLDKFLKFDIIDFEIQAKQANQLRFIFALEEDKKWVRKVLQY